MATSEQSFADRLQRGRSLQHAIAGFQPAFQPADGSLAPAPFKLFLDGLQAMNTAVTNSEAQWKDIVSQRSQLVEEIKARALRAGARVKSNIQWKAQQAAVKTAADNLRGYRTPAAKAPADAAAAPVRKVAKSDQSFGDIKNLLDKLTAALERAEDYDDGAPVDISRASLSSLATQLDGLNQLVAGKEQALAAARTPRRIAYEEDTGNTLCLLSRMKAIKEGTKAQYGASSSQYAQIKGIKS